MVFIQRGNFPKSRISSRIYLSEEGFASAFNNDPGEAFEFYNVVLKKLERYFLENYNFLMIRLFGASDQKKGGLFAYSFKEEWPGNPSIRAFRIETTGSVDPGWNDDDGDFTLVRAVEEKYRRKHCSNLEGFIYNPVDLRELKKEGVFR